MASSSQLPRIVLVAAIVLTVISGAKNYMNRSAVKDAIAQRDTEKNNILALSVTVKKATDEAKAAKEELKTLAEAKATDESKANSSTAAVEKAKKDLAAATAKIMELETQNRELTAKANAPVPMATPVPVEDPELVKKVADAEAKAAEKEQLLKTVQSKVEEVEKKAAALEAENARRLAGLNKPGLEGKVLAVNPNWNFVVLSIGDRQGVVAGSSLIVKRGGSLVAKLRVTSVEPSTSIADIQAGSISKGSTVQPGDVVIFPGS